MWMSFGFWLALRLPVKVTVALAVIGELVAHDRSAVPRTLSDPPRVHLV
jgi:hypothetical protein